MRWGVIIGLLSALPAAVGIGLDTRSLDAAEAPAVDAPAVDASGDLGLI